MAGELVHFAPFLVQAHPSATILNVVVLDFQLDDCTLPRAVWPSLTLANVSAAGFGLGPLAPGSIATALGVNLASKTAQATGVPPVSLGGAAVSVSDSAGVVRPAPLYYVSPEQVNYVIPADTTPGLAIVSITANGHVTVTGQIQNGDQTFESIYQTDQNGNITALPIYLGSATDTVYLVLYGTGIGNVRSVSAVSATIGWAFSTHVTRGN